MARDRNGKSIPSLRNLSNSLVVQKLSPSPRPQAQPVGFSPMSLVEALPQLLLDSCVVTVTYAVESECMADGSLKAEHFHAACCSSPPLSLEFDKQDDSSTPPSRRRRPRERNNSIDQLQSILRRAEDPETRKLTKTQRVLALHSINEESSWAPARTKKHI
eukprot:1761684-Amphidinium_carterae.1